MKLDLVPESLHERLLLATGAVPGPIVHTLVALLMSRTLLAAVRLGVFDALSQGPCTPEELASRQKMDPDATRTLLRALAGLGYVETSALGYTLTRNSRKWLVAGGRLDLTDAILHRYLDMRLMDRAEEYLRSGEPTRFHANLSDQDWRVYLNGQKAQASLIAPEVVRKTPLPKGATDLLDIGGGHGLFSDAMCRKHPNLRAVVLDLPEALDRVSRDGLSNRVTFHAADILSHDPGDHTFDLVFIGNLIHHFTDDESRSVLEKAARALREGGVCVVADFVQPSERKTVDQIPALLDFYFAVASGGGTRSVEEMVGWMRDAGFNGIQTKKLRSAPGMELLIGERRHEGSPHKSGAYDFFSPVG